jgi:hypothetical protein
MPQDPNIVSQPQGGLGGLDVPETMFGGEGYASGGLVAFAEGGDTAADPYANTMSEFDKMLAMVEAKYGAAGPGPYQKMQEEALLKQTQNDPEQRKQDLYGALAKFGFGLAGSKSPFFLQGVGEAASAAVPDIMAAAKERRNDKRQGISGLAALEQRNADQKREGLKLTDTLFGTTSRVAEGARDRTSREKISESEMALQRERLKADERNSIRQANASLAAARLQVDRKTDFDTAISLGLKAAKASGDTRNESIIANEVAQKYLETKANYGLGMDKNAMTGSIQATKLADAALGPGGPYSRQFSKLPPEQKQAFKTRIINYYKTQLGVVEGNPAADFSGFSATPVK